MLIGYARVSSTGQNLDTSSRNHGITQIGYD